MDWFKVMLEEHVIVLRIAEAFNLYAKRVGEGKAVPAPAMAGLLELADTFTERNHHAKEEAVLFPILARKHVSDRKMIDALVREHAIGSGLMRKMGGGGKDAVKANVDAYTALLRGHIIKENKFFKECDSLLEQWERNGMMGEFERIDAEVLGPGGRKEWAERVLKLKEVLERP